MSHQTIEYKNSQELETIRHKNIKEEIDRIKSEVPNIVYVGFYHIPFGIILSANLHLRMVNPIKFDLTQISFFDPGRVNIYKPNYTKLPTNQQLMFDIKSYFNGDEVHFLPYHPNFIERLNNLKMFY